MVKATTNHQHPVAAVEPFPVQVVGETGFGAKHSIPPQHNRNVGKVLVDEFRNLHATIGTHAGSGS